MNSKSNYLSKSTFLRGLQCYKSLYLYKHHPELRSEVSESQEAIFERGKEVGYFARKLFPDGVEIPHQNLSLKEQLAITKSEIEKGTKILYEGAFSYDGVFARVDILTSGEDDWEIYEVKSSTSVKEQNINDVSLQYYILKGLEMSISRVYIVHINNEYVRKGDIEIDKLFAIHDMTEIVKEKQKFIKNEVKKQRGILSGEIPEIDIGEYCSTPYPCDFKGYCWRDIPEESVFALRGRGIDKIEFYRKGIIHLKDVSQDSLSDYQRMQLEGTLEKKNFINRENIEKFLSSLWYPLYFLDFETFDTPIPPFDGIRPYQKIPFQYSLHYLEKEDAQLKHFEYLAKSNIDPRYEMVEKLLNEIPSHACVVVYNSSFEKGILENFSGWFPHLEDKIQNISNNIIDIMLPFKDRDVYFHKMNGSYSMKAVLPALVPELSYEEMEVKNGNEANIAYFAMRETDDPEEVEKIRQHLLEYCKLDSLGMVRILEKLKELATL